MLIKVEGIERYPVYIIDSEYPEMELEIEVSGREEAWIRQTQEAYEAVQKLIRERVKEAYETRARQG